jgi:hypothetical protein
MRFTDYKIDNGRLVISNALKRKLFLRFPFKKIPALNSYSEEIREYCKSKGQLPFFTAFDINNDNEDELILILISRTGGFGDIVIASKNGSLKRIKWKRPMNALYFDYLIEKSDTSPYSRFGLFSPTSTEEERRLNIQGPHILTKGYLTRVLYWDGHSYKQERISTLGET